MSEKQSFSQQVKKEITEHPPLAPCCVTAACYGVACFGKYFDNRGVVLHTDSEFIARWALELYTAAGITGGVRLRNAAAGSWEFSVKDPFEVEKMLAAFSHAGDETTLRIRRENLECGSCFAAFLSAAFLCCGTVIDPAKGYTLEFVSPRHRLMRDFTQLLADHDFEPHMTQRNGANVVYFKASEQIEDLLTTMGASMSALEIMNLKVYKDFRNRANRITNCETANIEKIVSANRQTLDAIRLLEQAGALEALPPPLQSAARLRRAHPELGLAELAALSEEPVSKSGLSHRYKKIREKAEKIRQKSS